MKRITIEVSDTTVEALRQLAVTCSQADGERNGFTTHGKLTPASLLAMLAEDAAMVVTRPGSWEGANMAQVFVSHGYDV